MSVAGKMGGLEILENPVKVGWEMADTSTAFKGSVIESLSVNRAQGGWQAAKATSGLSCRCPVPHVPEGGERQ